jgi:hypothetical protein
MTTTIQILKDRRISSLISEKYGSIMSERDAEMMDYCQTMGEVWIGMVNDDLVACWGLIPPSFLADQAYLWMWVPPDVKHQFLLVRHSQIQIKKMLDRYDMLVGHCMVGSRSARQWLQWLGAEFGLAQGPLVPFEIRRA